MNTIKRNTLGVLSGLTLMLNAGQALSASTFASAEIDWSTFSITGYALNSGNAPSFTLTAQSSLSNSSISDWLNWTADTSNNAVSYSANTTGNGWGSGAGYAQRNASLSILGSGFLVISADYTINAAINGNSCGEYGFYCYDPSFANATVSFDLSNNSSHGLQSSRDQSSINLGGNPWSYPYSELTTDAKTGTLSVGVLVNTGDILNFASNIAVTAYDNGLNSIPPAAVPVPAGVWLFCSGLMAMLGLGRRK